jgi:hypothetical protein
VLQLACQGHNAAQQWHVAANHEAPRGRVASPLGLTRLQLAIYFRVHRRKFDVKRCKLARRPKERTGSLPRYPNRNVTLRNSGVRHAPKDQSNRRKHSLLTLQGNSSGDENGSDPLKYWETVADDLSKAGWSWGCVAAIDSNGRTIFIADAHRDDGRRLVAHADEKLTAFVELEAATRARQRVVLTSGQDVFKAQHNLTEMTLMTRSH